MRVLILLGLFASTTVLAEAPDWALGAKKCNKRVWRPLYTLPAGGGDCVKGFDKILGKACRLKAGWCLKRD
jgi:hypothetical protein